MDMRYRLLFSIFVSFFLIVSCREIEDPKLDFGKDYQPLELGLFWIYEVEETLVFGENDSQTEQYFIRDIVDYNFFNSQNEEIFVIRRERSDDKINWVSISGYSMQFRGNVLLKNIENLKTVNLVLPAKVGVIWDAMVYNSSPRDDFEIEFMGDRTIGRQIFQRSLLVRHGDDDDKITFRDKRYEVYTMNVGMVEYYYEVLTYCRRNDCLGQMIKDSGRKTHMKLAQYGKL
jgi:hypothetical protein